MSQTTGASMRGEGDQQHGRPVERDGADDRPAEPHPSGDRARQERSAEAPERADAEDDACRRRAETQLPVQVDRDDREDHVAEQVRRRGSSRDRAQVPVPEDEAESFGDLPAEWLAGEACLTACRFGMRLGALDPRDEECRGEVAERVGDDRERRADQADERPAEAGSDHAGRRLARLELGVALHQLVGSHERGQVRLVRDIEEDRRDAGDEADRVELPDRQCSQRPRGRDGAERHESHEVPGDQDRTPPKPVDPRARGEREQEERQELEDAKQGHLEDARLQGHRRDVRDREEAHLRAELADRLADPEATVVVVAEQPEAAAYRDAHGSATGHAHLAARDSRVRSGTRPAPVVPTSRHLRGRVSLASRGGHPDQVNGRDDRRGARGGGTDRCADRRWRVATTGAGQGGYVRATHEA